MLNEFKDFIATGNLIEIAVGLVLAIKFTDVINSFMDGIVNPIISAIFGQPDMSETLAFDLGDSRVMPGLLLTALINLIIVGFVLFLVLKAYNKMKKAKPAAPAGPTEVELLTEIRDSLRSR
ncbi:MAG: large conductance mechanosensitive channel protein MscL [Acidimicrobiia bacterium]